MKQKRRNAGIATILAFLLLLSTAFAQDDSAFSAPERSAMGNLTEVYGYTQQEAEAFDFTVTETGTQWHIEFSPPDHPDWVYTTDIDKASGQFIDGTTPFAVSGYVDYPGEGTVRDGLRTAQENGWFTDLSAENRSAFMNWMEKWGVQPNDTLISGLTDGNITPAEAINAYFLSCYGETYAWPTALTQWRDEVLSSYGLTLATQSEPVTGIRQEQTQTARRDADVNVTMFAGEAPSDLATVLAHPKLAGWNCDCGAYVEYGNAAIVGAARLDTGLLSFSRDGARILTMIRRADDDEDWTVLPVGEQALLTGRDLSISYDAQENEFVLEYPVTDTESEFFRVRIRTDSDTGNTLCELVNYRHTDADSTVLIDGDGTGADADAYWYHVTVYENGAKTTEEQDSAIIIPFLEYLDADAFPKTVEACREAGGYTLPDGCGVTCGVHLRAKTSSRSADLGLYNPETIVQILGQEPGDPYPWYHVRIGEQEGYMAGIYVAYTDSVCVMEPLQQYMPLPVAMTTKDVALKKGTGWFAGTVATLPAGTKMHVLATKGKWLHVMVPQSGEPGWQMDTDGTDGYVKASDVVQAATALQLDWME